MNEVAWCYLEGFGTKKDKVSRPPSRLALPAVHHPSARPPKLGNPSPSDPAEGQEDPDRPAIRKPLLNPDGTAVAVGHQRPTTNHSPSLAHFAPFACHIRLADAQHQQQYTAAKYYRLAEKNGNKIIGNTW